MLHINTEIGVMRRTPFIWKCSICYSISMVKLSAHLQFVRISGLEGGGKKQLPNIIPNMQLNFFLLAHSPRLKLGLPVQPAELPQTWQGPFQRLKNTPCSQSFNTTICNTTCYYSAHTWIGSPRLSRINTDCTETNGNTQVFRKAGEVYCLGSEISARGK